jgi:hypothetical protein
MAQTVNGAWLGTPTDSTSIAQVDDHMRNTKEGWHESMAKEHQSYLDTTDYAIAANRGWHKAGSAKAYVDTTNPTVRPDASSTVLSSSDQGRLFVKTAADTTLADSQANELLFYDGTLGWTELNYFSEQVKFAKGFIIGSADIGTSNMGGILSYDTSYILSDVSASTTMLQFPDSVTYCPVSGATACKLGDTGGYEWNEVHGDLVYGAVGNDFADELEGFSEETMPIPGYAYAMTGKGIMLTDEYAQKGVIGVLSDSASFVAKNKNVGGKKGAFSVAGFVLAYVDREYPIGTPLTCTKWGKLTRANWIVRLFHSERILGTYLKKMGVFWGDTPTRGRALVKVV